jgi:branched-chain amino acid transport system ATP-binding protein
MTLEVTGLHVYYGGSHVIQGVDLTVGPGEAVAVLGRNGAGKTTTMRAICGLTSARRGRVTLDGRDISGLSPHRRARLGLSFVPSGRRAFDALTVRQNLEVAARARRRGGAGGWNLPRVLDTFPRLGELAGRRAGFLSGGEQQMLKIARGLLCRPRVLLLDEPTEGLSPAVVKDLGRWLEVLRGEGLTLVVTEQNALFLLAHSDRGYVLEKGRIRFQADAATLRASDEIRAYLGVGGVAAASPPAG